MRFRQELEEVLGKKTILAAQIKYQGKTIELAVNHTKEELDKFLKSLQITYSNDSALNTQSMLFTGYVWLTNKDRLERVFSGNIEMWKKVKHIDIPEYLLGTIELEDKYKITYQDFTGVEEVLYFKTLRELKLTYNLIQKFCDDYIVEELVNEEWLILKYENFELSSS